MATRPDLSSGWITYEVYEKDTAGRYSFTPFGDALTASGSLAAQPVTKMRLLQEIGWPAAKRFLKDSNGRPLIVKKDEVIWLLKCKPSCWRLYFYVWEEKKFIIYVHAVCKKADSEDPAEAIEARRVADRIRPGGSGITPFEFPNS